MNHEVEVSNLMFNKTSDEQIDFKKYDINVDLEEESSNEGKTILKYSLDLTSNPKNSVINISGNTILSGEQEEIEDFLKQENEKTPEVVSLIYQELFPLMYIITKMEKLNSNEQIDDNLQQRKEEFTKTKDENESASDVSESASEDNESKQSNPDEENNS
jgi:hypothetical protein